MFTINQIGDVTRGGREAVNSDFLKPVCFVLWISEDEVLERK